MKAIFLSILFILMSLSITAETIVPGGYVEGIWTLAESPFTVLNYITIPQGSQLVIEPGVAVNFNSGAGLTVQGCLKCVGTAADSILLTGPSLSWSGIKIEGMDWSSDSTRISYTIISNSIDTGIQLLSATRLSIKNCLITHNSGSSAGGIFGTDTTPIITDNIISENTSSSYGGGLTFWGNSFPYLARNIISGNIAVVNAGGGITFYNSHPILVDNVIKDNTSMNSAGGGVYYHNSTIHMTGNIIMNNSAADYGGGVCSWSGCAPQIVNNLISNNTAVYGGGFYSFNASIPVLTNCTITNNFAEYGGGIYTSDCTDLALKNSILWGNEALNGNQIYLDFYSNAYVSYSCVEDGYQSFAGPGSEGFDPNDYRFCTESDPLFSEPSTGTGNLFYANVPGWRFNSQSPCYETGDPIMTDLFLPSYDVLGNNRVFGSRIDMGALEYDGEPSGNNPVAIAEKQLSNYPNPFNPSTTISFGIPVQQQISLKIYNSRGQLVKSLVNKQLNPGNYKIPWNGTNDNAEYISAGIYFSVLKTDKGQQTSKMLLLK